MLFQLQLPAQLGQLAAWLCFLCPSRWVNRAAAACAIPQAQAPLCWTHQRNWIHMGGRGPGGSTAKYEALRQIRSSKLAVSGHGVPLWRPHLEGEAKPWWWRCEKMWSRVCCPQGRWPGVVDGLLALQHDQGEFEIVPEDGTKETCLGSCNIDMGIHVFRIRGPSLGSGCAEPAVRGGGVKLQTWARFLLRVLAWKKKMDPRFFCARRAGLCKISYDRGELTRARLGSRISLQSPRRSLCFLRHFGDGRCPGWLLGARA